MKTQTNFLLLSNLALLLSCSLAFRQVPLTGGSTTIITDEDAHTASQPTTWDVQEFDGICVPDSRTGTTEGCSVAVFDACVCYNDGRCEVREDTNRCLECLDEDVYSVVHEYDVCPTVASHICRADNAAAPANCPQYAVGGCICYNEGDCEPTDVNACVDCQRSDVWAVFEHVGCPWIENSTTTTTPVAQPLPTNQTTQPVQTNQSTETNQTNQTNGTTNQTAPVLTTQPNQTNTTGNNQANTTGNNQTNTTGNNQTNQTGLTSNQTNQTAQTTNQTGQTNGTADADSNNNNNSTDTNTDTDTDTDNNDNDNGTDADGNDNDNNNDTDTDTDNGTNQTTPLVQPVPTNVTNQTIVAPQPTQPIAAVPVVPAVVNQTEETA